MLTIFASPRPFVGEFDVIQRNAIASWTRIRPRPQILLMGSDEGTARACDDFGVEHVPEVRVNAFGIPYADSMLELAERRAAHPLLLWVTADTILFDDVLDAARRVSARFDRFCVVAGRYHLADPSPIAFDDPAWADRVRAAAGGTLLDDIAANDFFLFPKRLWGVFPPFLEGRLALDNWMLFRVLETGAALVDGTAAIMTIHQDHRWRYHPADDAAGTRFHAEVRYNRGLAGGRILTRDNATWMLTPDGFRRPPWTIRRHFARCARVAAVHPRLGWPLRAYCYAADRLLLRPAAERADAMTRAGLSTS